MVVKDEDADFQQTMVLIPSIGMQSIRDRAQAEGGTADWSSAIGKGTEILVRIPY
jgi:two-component system NarL family sensor kinase